MAQNKDTLYQSAMKRKYLFSRLLYYIDGISIKAKNAANAKDVKINTHPIIVSLRLFSMSVLEIFAPISITTPTANINTSKLIIPTASPT